MNIVDLAILKKMVAGGGGSGTDNYNDLSNLPQINGETLAGNKTAANLGLQDALTFDSAPTEDSTNPVESGGVYNALAGKQDNLTFDDDPTENSTNPVKSGGVYSALAGKQDNLTFDGVYNASTNKAATESTVTNAIAGLDVSALSVDADETISSISETDGKINVTKQDIAIVSNQVTAMTGYTKPSSAPATPAIQTSDTANQAFGKLEFKADTNQSNILLVQNLSGVKNCIKIWPISDWTGIPIGLTISINSDGAYVFNGTVSSGYKYIQIGTLAFQANTTYYMYHSALESGGYVYTADNNLASSVGNSYTYTANGTTGVIIRIGMSSASVTYNNEVIKPMIITKAVYDAGFTDYQPYAAPNYDLTRLEAEDRAALAEVVDSGAKNLLDIPSTQTVRDRTFTKDSDDWVTSNNASDPTAWIASNANITFTLKAGNYTFTGFSKAGNTDNIEFSLMKSDSTEIVHATTVLPASSEQSVSIDFTLTATTTVYVMYKVRQQKGRFMITTKAAFGVSPKFVPHCRIPKVIADLYKEIAGSTTLTNTGLEYYLESGAKYRITAFAEYGASNPLEIVICQSNGVVLGQSSISPASGTTIGYVVATGYINAKTARTITLQARFANATTNYVGMIVEKL